MAMAPRVVAAEARGDSSEATSSLTAFCDSVAAGFSSDFPAEGTDPSGGTDPLGRDGSGSGCAAATVTDEMDWIGYGFENRAPQKARKRCPRPEGELRTCRRPATIPKDGPGGCQGHGRPPPFQRLRRFAGRTARAGYETLSRRGVRPRVYPPRPPRSGSPGCRVVYRSCR